MTARVPDESPWFWFLVHYYVKEGYPKRQKMFRHNGSKLDELRALNEAKEFASLHHWARIDRCSRAIEVQNAGKVPLE